MIELQDYFIEPATWAMDRPDLKVVRAEVFVLEQSVPEDEEFDQLDPVCNHFLARDLNGLPIGTARLTPEGCIGRVAVTTDWRGKGVGDALIRNMIELARLKSMPELTLASQTHAIDFYRRYGFQPFGEEFDDVGIPHLWMRLLLNPAAVGHIERERRQVQTIESNEPVDYSLRDEYRQHLLGLINSCKDELLLFTHDLEPAVLGDETIVEAIRQMVTRSPRPEVRIMLKDSTRAVKDRHLLVPLAHRMTSVLHLRRPGKQHADRLAAFAVGDRSHCLYREFGDRWEGVFRPNDRRYARTLAEWFRDAWEMGFRDPDLERLDL